MKNITIFLILFIFTNLSYAEQNEDVPLIKFDKLTKQAFDQSKNISKDESGQITLNTKNTNKNIILTRINKEGGFETYCTNNEKNAKRFLSGETISSIEGGFVK